VIAVWANEIGPLQISNRYYTIGIRKSSNLKLPGCIRAATSLVLNASLPISDRELSKMPILDVNFY
jgi:hypothetical protein